MTFASLHHWQPSFGQPGDSSRFQKGKDLGTRGFTFVELLVVMAIVMFLLGLSVPFVTSLRSEIAMRSTVGQVKTDLVTALGYSLSGKSMAALSARSMKDFSLIPGAYGLYFESSTDYGASHPYQYLEFGSGSPRILYNLKKDNSSPVVFLRHIRVKTSPSDPGRAVDRLTLLFFPPFGRVGFATDSLPSIPASYSVDSLGGLVSDPTLVSATLEFQYKDDSSKNTILSFGKDKVISEL